MNTLSAENFSQWFHSALNFIIGFGNDFFVFIITAGLVVGFAFFIGRNRLMPLIAGLYTAIPIYIFFPFQSTLLSDPWIALALYAVTTFLAYTAFSGLSHFMGSAPRSFLRVGSISVIVAGMLLAVGIHVLPLENIIAFNAVTKALFASNLSFFLWLIAPLGALFFLER